MTTTDSAAATPKKGRQIRIERSKPSAPGPLDVIKSVLGGLSIHADIRFDGGTVERLTRPRPDTDAAARVVQDRGSSPEQLGQAITPVPGAILSTVTGGQQKWLWEGRVPIGAVTVIEGDPDLGKSLLTLALAAYVTTGRPMPFETTPREPRGVVLANAEDSLVDTLVPRAQAAGADLDRIRALSTAECVGVLQRLDRLEAAVRSVDAGLVILDPLMALLGNETNARVDQSVREVLSTLAEIADRSRAAILLVRHLTKTSTPNAKYRGSGSIGITGGARSVLVASEHPSRPGEKLLSSVKCNVGAAPAPVTYRLVAEGTSARVEWLEQVEVGSAEEG